MKTKAIVSKIKEDEGTMIVLTTDRQFLRMPLPGGNLPLLGQTIEIEFPLEKNKVVSLFNKKKISAMNQWNKKWVSIAAVFMLVFLSMFYGQFGVTKAAAAYVNLDKKPSVQLKIDKKGFVQEVVGLNTEGKRLADSISINEKDVYSATQTIIREANRLGYLTSNQNVLVMASVVQLTKAENPLINEQLLRQMIDQELASKQMSGYIVMNQATKEQWKQANDSGYTMNEYMVLEHAKEHGIELQQEQLTKEHHLTEYVSNSKVPVEQLFPNNSYRVNWQNENMREENDQKNNNRQSSDMNQDSMQEHKQYESEKQQNQQSKQPMNQGSRQMNNQSTRSEDSNTNTSSRNDPYTQDRSTSERNQMNPNSDLNQTDKTQMDSDRTTTPTIQDRDRWRNSPTETHETGEWSSQSEGDRNQTTNWHN